ncbi:MAG TPA: PHP domain-containing protein, partial [Rhizomicrobium sp.]|nr:PHP domain-containing protein [Rhizomicrobium sp.]
MITSPFAEIGVTTNFSFLRGASHPDEMAHQATLLGYHAIGIADRNTLAGIVRMYHALKQLREKTGFAPKLL